MDFFTKESIMNEIMLAACGLDCGSCEIRLAPFDPSAAKVIVDWFRSRGWLTTEEGIEQVIEKKMYCTGCLGDRSTHWDSHCWILNCCVDRKHCSNCSECEDFPCSRLVEWSTQNEGYRVALARLRQLR